MTRIAVGVATRRRAEMLGVLLDSYVAMKRPRDAEVIFLIVENDDSPRQAPVVDAFRARVPEQVVHVCETRTGIPFARNRGLDEATALGADYLTYVDDDERVDADWLVELMAMMQRSDLDLGGGRVPVEAAGTVETLWQAAVLEAMQTRRARALARRLRQRSEGDEVEHAIFTNNWCLRLAFAHEQGLRFDETLVDTGGSDTAFAIALRNAGGRVGWTETAIVHDRMPPRRLTLRYMAGQARAHGAGMVRWGVPEGRERFRRPCVFMWRGFQRMTAGLWKGRAHFADGLREFAFGWGEFWALFGRQVHLYGAKNDGWHFDD